MGIEPMRRFTQWLIHKWVKQTDDNIAQFYQVTYSTPQGQRVLQHQLDNIYCQIYEGNDPLVLAYHNGRRSVVHETLELIDEGENPQKHTVNVEQEILDLEKGLGVKSGT